MICSVPEVETELSHFDTFQNKPHLPFKKANGKIKNNELCYN